jgi:hypothetical protein
VAILTPLTFGKVSRLVLRYAAGSTGSIIDDDGGWCRGGLANPLVDFMMPLRPKAEPMMAVMVLRSLYHRYVSRSWSHAVSSDAAMWWRITRGEAVLALDIDTPVLLFSRGLNLAGSFPILIGMAVRATVLLP